MAVGEEGVGRWYNQGNVRCTSHGPPLVFLQPPFAVGPHRPRGHRHASIWPVELSLSTRGGLDHSVLKQPGRDAMQHRSAAATAVVTILCQCALSLGTAFANELVPRLRVGDIQHEAVFLVPLPRDRNDFGGGEDVDCWVDVQLEPRPEEALAAADVKALLPGAAGEVVWTVNGGAAYPIVGIRTRVRIDLPGKKDSEVAISVRVVVPERIHDERRVADALTVPTPLVETIWRDDSRAALGQAFSCVADPHTVQRSETRPMAEDQHAGEGLSSALSDLKNLHRGMEASIADVQQVGGALLEQYQRPEERGRIHYEIAHILAQCGMREPDAVINHAREALENPIPIEQQLRLHVYWGDALRLRPSKEEFLECRKAAAQVYLAGLDLLHDYALPDRPPEPPDEAMVIGDIGEAQVERNRIIREAIDRVRYIGDRILDREVLSRQIVDLYSRLPLATEELQELASSCLRDPASAAKLLVSLDDRLMLAQSPNGVEASSRAGSPTSNAGRWPMTIGLAILFAAVFCAYMLRRRSRLK